MSSVAVIIPARLASTRLERKLLLDRTGMPLIQHTFENACRAAIPDEVTVAADSPEIVNALRPFGTPAVLTSADHRSGTDRIAEAARSSSADIIINVQGDEPEIAPGTIDSLARTLMDDDACMMATAACPLPEESIADPACVKVVTDLKGYALYFSRAPIPFLRDTKSGYPRPPLLHMGIYAYRSQFLQTVTSLEQTPYERTERLEQLRVIENGHRIKVITVPASAPGIDTAEDYDRFAKRFTAAEEIADA
jgi:3-deoxy-manno-octulosonate cytidylyltransferase (CMP-KDO synthetase)